jgi:membrane protein implicated in regulation of membrane protease activity
LIAEYIVSHQSEFWMVVGFVLLAIEVVVGFSIGIFLFGGMGALATGLFMSFGVIPETWIAGIASTGISSAVITALLWRPFKILQGNRLPGKDNSSDLIGLEFVTSTDLSADESGSHLYSGVQWKVKIDRDSGIGNIKAGQKVTVTSVEVGLFKVKLSQREHS